TSSAKPAPVASSSASGVPFFGLFPVFAYDAGHRQVVLLNFRAQTWLWSNHQWVLAHPTVAPPRRTGAAVAWDPDMKAVLLFGGQASGNEGLLHDTWAWNGSNWRDVGTGGPAPPPSLMSTMTYDGKRHEMVLVESDVYFGAPVQLWTWNGTAWRRRSVSGAPSSPVAAIGFDPQTGSVVAIAGDCSGFECRSQTWSWDGTSWRQLRPAHEPDFAFYSMATAPDPISGQLLLLTVSSNTLGPAPTQTWSWDGRDWVGLQLIGHPGAEVKLVAAPGDNGTETVVAFEDVSRDLNTLRLNGWQWTGSAWRTISP
ncbi:MAG: hypothetical protein M3Z28_04145, partial [Candidatus Dormibacteraeota bacterium]|nr:hypothetical protein [Candidatus Dormibacteraeota bacterium]